MYCFRNKPRVTAETEQIQGSVRQKISKIACTGIATKLGFDHHLQANKVDNTGPLSRS